MFWPKSKTNAPPTSAACVALTDSAGKIPVTRSGGAIVGLRLPSTTALPSASSTYRGKTVRRQRKATERQWEGRGRARKGSEKVVEGQGKAVEGRKSTVVRSEWRRLVAATCMPVGAVADKCVIAIAGSHDWSPRLV